MVRSNRLVAILSLSTSPLGSLSICPLSVYSTESYIESALHQLSAMMLKRKNLYSRFIQPLTIVLLVTKPIKPAQSCSSFFSCNQIQDLVMDSRITCCNFRKQQCYLKQRGLVYVTSHPVSLLIQYHWAFSSMAC